MCCFQLCLYILFYVAVVVLNGGTLTGSILITKFPHYSDGLMAMGWTTTGLLIVLLIFAFIVTHPFHVALASAGTVVLGIAAFGASLGKGDYLAIYAVHTLVPLVIGTYAFTQWCFKKKNYEPVTLN